ncbi:MAG: membrane dipeptidase [Anaerolineales bacterium]
MFLIDAHQDLAWNMLTFDRDYTRSAAETRRLEQGSDIVQHNGDTLLGWPEYQRGHVGLIFATIYIGPKRRALGAWDKLSYETLEEAHRFSNMQLDAYHRLVEAHPDKFRLIGTQGELDTLLEVWQPLDGAPPAGEDHPSQGVGHPVGLILLIENAEGVRSPEELPFWWEGGVRLIGPAWARTRFCGGTREPGPLTPDGYALLEGMAHIGFGLDISHMDEQAVLQALDVYPGVIVASHANVLALLPGIESNRFLSDRVIDGLLARDGVIGVIPANYFLDPDWRTHRDKTRIGLQAVAEHIDYICQRAGNARHVALGTDFDGGFGAQTTPREVDTIADMQKLAPILAEMGYSQADLRAIFYGNWRERLTRLLPA